mgnify:CR=1 FL=1
MQKRLLVSQGSVRPHTVDKKKLGLQLPNLNTIVTPGFQQRDLGNNMNINKLTISTPFSTSHAITLTSPHGKESPTLMAKTFSNFNLKKPYSTTYTQLRRADTQESYALRDISTPKGDEFTELKKYRSQRSLRTAGNPLLSPKERIPVSKFLFDTNEPSETELENKEYFPTKHDPRIL